MRDRRIADFDPQDTGLTEASYNDPDPAIRAASDPLAPGSVVAGVVDPGPGLQAFGFFNPHVADREGGHLHSNAWSLKDVNASE